MKKTVIQHIWIKLFICLVSLVGLTACSALKGVAQKPSVSIDKVSIATLSTQSADLLVTLIIDNPNAFTLKTVGIDLALYVTNKKLLAIKQPDATLSIPAKSRKRVLLPVKIAFKELASTVVNLPKQNEIPFQIKGAVNLVVPVLGKLRQSVSYSDAVPIPRMPKVTLNRMDLTSINLTRAKLEFELKIKNPNVFPIKLDKLDYQLKAQKQTITGGKIHSVLMAPEKEQNLVIPLTIKVKQLGRHLYKALVKGESITLDAEFDVNVIPDIVNFHSASKNAAMKLHFSTQQKLTHK